MLNKKLIISLFAASLLSGCASMLNDLTGALDGKTNNSTPDTSNIKTVQSSKYKINSFLRYTMSYNLDDYIKIWGKPAEVYKLPNDYLAKWTPFSNKNCEVYINFTPKTLQSKPLDYYLDGCENITMTGPVIEIPKNEVFHPGFMKTRDITLNDRMEAWIGLDIDKALVKWGSPQSTVPLNSGGRVYTWKTYWESARDGWGNYTYGNCEQTLVTNSKGIISNWNYSNCRRDNYGKIPSIVLMPQPRAN